MYKGEELLLPEELNSYLLLTLQISYNKSDKFIYKQI